MYNPTLEDRNFNNRNRRIEPSKTDGTRHSDILKKGAFNTQAPASARIPTPTGYSSAIFECGDFSVRYEVIFAGNSIGYGVNPKGDRTIRVLQGSLYLRDTGPEYKLIHQGQHISVKRGEEHGYATSGTDNAELLIIETKDYAKTWKILEAPISSDTNVAAFETAAVVQAREEVKVKGKVGRPKRDSAKAKAIAEELAREVITREQNKPAKETRGERFNPNSAASNAMNPRPMGLVGLGDE